MSPVLPRRHKTNLGISAFAAAGAWTADGLAIALLAGDSSVLPSMLTRRHTRYQAPFAAAAATGLTTSSRSCRGGFHPKRVLACEMPEFPAA